MPRKPKNFALFVSWVRRYQQKNSRRFWFSGQKQKQLKENNKQVLREMFRSPQPVHSLQEIVFVGFCVFLFVGFLFCILVVRCTVFVPVAPPSQLVRCNKAWTRASRRSQGTARHPKTVAKKNVLMNGSKAGIRPLPCRPRIARLLVFYLDLCEQKTLTPKKESGNKRNPLLGVSMTLKKRLVITLNRVDPVVKGPY